MTNDTIPVRPDERFDQSRLERYLRGRLVGSEQPLKVLQFGGGAANLTYLLDYGEVEYVLRRPPLGPVAKSAHDMGREYKVLSVLSPSFPFAPRAFLYCDDQDVIGAPFFIMERRHGIVVRREMPEIFAAVPDAPRKMSEALVDALAAFHAVEYEALGLADLGYPEGFVSRQIEGWYKRWGGAKHKEVPDIEKVYHWLRENQPQTTQFSLTHNDYKLDNVMFDAHDPGRIVAIFDWDMCTLGDPLCDLGALLCYWTEPDDPAYMRQSAMMPTTPSGFLTRSELIARYAEKSGCSVNDINFYHALGLFRLTVIIAQIYIRFLRGQTQDQRFVEFGAMIPLLARAAKDIALG